MWPDVFDPENLNPDASLNKLVIGPVSGAKPVHVGASGGDLLGRDAIVRLVQHRCGVVVRHDAVSDWLVAAMEADPSGGPAAVVEEMGTDWPPSWRRCGILGAPSRPLVAGAPISRCGRTWIWSSSVVAS